MIHISIRYMKDILCENCGKLFSKMGIGSHKWRVRGKGQDFKPISNGTGHVAWNKGLTSSNDERVAKGASALKERYESGDLVSWHAGKTKHTDERIASRAIQTSETIQQKIKEGTWHLSFSKRHTYDYRGAKLHGTWELRYAMWLDENHISWIRNTKMFPYTFEEKERNYIPDFYLPEEDVYIEIKGYETEKDRCKWKVFPLNLRILKGKDLKEMGIIDEYKTV